MKIKKVIKNRKIIIIGLLVLFIILVFVLMPREEELYTTPVIEAYSNDELQFVDVKQGDLIKKATIGLTVQNNGEKQLSFNYNDLGYEGIYVKEGDSVKSGQLLAKLNPDGKEGFVADSSKLELKAPFDGIVTFALEIEEGERSINNQAVVIVNRSDEFVVSAFTPYWSYFETGQNYKGTILGKEMDLTVVNEEDIGVEKYDKPTEEGASSRVYFITKPEDTLLYSGIPGSLSVVLDEKKNVLYIPSNAVNKVNDEYIVYVENEDGIRTIRSVITGLDTGSFVEIVEGLSLGERVIID